MDLLLALKPFIELGITGLIALGLLAIVRADRKESQRAQARIASVLENHLSEIGAHMAGTNKALDLIVNRLLDAGLRKPEDGGSA